MGFIKDGVHIGLTSDGMKLGIASDYVDFCLALNYQDLPVEVVERVKQLKLDYIGTPAYGTQADSSRAMLEFIRSLNLKGYCTLIGTSTKCSARVVIKTKDRRKREAFFERPAGRVARLDQAIEKQIGDAGGQKHVMTVLNISIRFDGRDP